MEVLSRAMGNKTWRKNIWNPVCGEEVRTTNRFGFGQTSKAMTQTRPNSRWINRASAVSSTISSISVSAKGTARLSNADTLLEKVGEDKQERQCAPHVFVWGSQELVCHIVRVIQHIYQTGSYSFHRCWEDYFTIRCVLISVGLLVFDRRKSDYNVWQELKESDRVDMMWCCGAGPPWGRLKC